MVKSQVCPNCDKSFSYDTISTRGPRKYCSDPCSEQSGGCGWRHFQCSLTV